VKHATAPASARRKTKAKEKAALPQRAAVTITFPDEAGLETIADGFAKSTRFVANAVADATAILALIDEETFSGDVLVRVCDHLKSKPISPQTVLALVLMAEARGRERRARRAGANRFGAARAWVLQQWDLMTAGERVLGKAAFARRIAPVLESQFETTGEKPLRVSPDTVAKVWLKGK
jgi:hypothetical protein